MIRCTSNLTFVVKSPFLFPGDQSAGFGRNVMALRNRDKVPLIPQDQLRGVFRHALLNVAATSQTFSTDDIDAMFGRGSSNASDDEEDPSAANFDPQRGRVFFSDLGAIGETGSHQATRIQIDDETGAVRQGHLLSTEIVAPLGDDVAFAGALVVIADQPELDRWIAALKAGATWISAIGSMKSVGFGEVVDVTLEPVSEVAMVAPAQGEVTASARVQTYALGFDRPFLVDARRDAGNVFHGSEVVPGGVLKGALAQKLRAMGQDLRDCETFSALKISHAVVEGQTGPLALSICLTKDGPDIVVGDALRAPVRTGVLLRNTPCRFQADWKTHERAAAKVALGIAKDPILARDVRTHVAIAAGTGTVEDGKLYVSNSVSPGGQVWRCQVDYGKMTDQAKRNQIQAALEDGLYGVGQTGANVSVKRIEAVGSPEFSFYDADSQSVALVLQTDALMIDANGQTVFDAYSEFWAAECPGAILNNFYSVQHLAGGYLARRFRAKAAYTPFLITQAGSVFLLSGGHRSDLENIVLNGLSRPRRDGAATTWQNCPFQPENGYGKLKTWTPPQRLEQVTYV
jgi:hypothetical protein